jgi:hypothetical protein
LTPWRRRSSKTGDRVAAILCREAEYLDTMGRDDALWPVLYRVGAFQMLTGDGGLWPSGAAKYALEVRRNAEMWRPMVPFMQGIGAAFELGVGPGYLFKYMQELFGTRMSGCDVRLDRKTVYDLIRGELGIRGLVVDHPVFRGVSTPVTPGCDAVLAFATVFDKEYLEDGTSRVWDVEDHRWFLADLARQLVGPRKLIVRFNRRWLKDNQEVIRFYRSIGTRPIKEDKRFFVVGLDAFV